MRRDALNLGEGIPVAFDVECAEFRVEDLPELEFSATYLAAGEIITDRSGDATTPNGAPSVSVELIHLRGYTITLRGERLPKWLEQLISTTFADEMDSAALSSIGGQDELDRLAIEESLK